MRLVVNQQGLRIAEDKQNVLTVVANESYEHFVAALQAEMEEAFGKEGAAPKPVNARQKRAAKRKPLDQLPKDFAELWERIEHKTRYQVTVDASTLITDVLAAVDKLKIDPPRIIAEKAVVESMQAEDKLEAKLVGKGVLATLIGRQPLPNLVEMLEDLIAHITPPIKLTRRTLAAIIIRTKNRQAALDNPQEFASQAARSHPR